jgi:hypothetical protein
MFRPISGPPQVHKWSIKHAEEEDTLYQSVKDKIHHHYHLPPWITSFDLFWHRHVAIISWGVHDLFFLKVGS